MRQIFAYESSTDLEKYQSDADHLFKKLTGYKEILSQEYRLEDPPKGVIWTSKSIATEVFSNVPIPAYTSRDVIFITPDVSEWRSVMLSQLDGKKDDEIESHYNKFDETSVLIILAHELTHHIELFPDDFGDNVSGIWFEEGMCEYLPRKILLSESQFIQEVQIHEKLAELFKKEYGSVTLEDFGLESYSGSMSAVMYNYWQSFLAVHHIVEEKYQGNIKKVFDVYNEWSRDACGRTFSEYINMNKYNLS